MKKFTKLCFLCSTLLALTSCKVGVEDENAGGSSGNNDETENNNQDSEETSEDLGTVVFNTVTHGTIKASATSAKVGELITLTGTPEEGYELTEVTVNGRKLFVENNKAEFIIVSGRNEVIAHFTLTEKFGDVVIKETTNGKIVCSKNGNTKVGEVVHINVLPDPDYQLEFIKLNDKAIEKDADGFYSFEVVEGKNELTSSFLPIVKTGEIKIIPSVNGTVNAKTLKGNEGDEILLTIEPEAGYVIDKLNYGADEVKVTNNEAKISLREGLDFITASFKAIPKSATLVIPTFKNGKITSNVSKTPFAGDEVTLTVIPDTGYVVKSYSVKLGDQILNLSETNEAKIILNAGENKIFAEFVKITEAASIKFAKSENGTFKASTINGNAGDKVTIEAVPSKGYKCNSITYNGENYNLVDNKVEITLVKGEKEVIGTFIEADNHATITIDVGLENGTIECDLKEGVVGDKARILVTPAEGFLIKKGSVKCNGKVVELSRSNVGNIILEKTNIITAEFEPEPHIVEITYNGNSKAYEVIGELKGVAGTEKIVKIVPKDNNEITEVTFNGTSVTPVDAKEFKYILKLAEDSNVLEIKSREIAKATIEVNENFKFYEHGTSNEIDASTFSGRKDQLIDFEIVPPANKIPKDAYFNNRIIAFNLSNKGTVKLIEGKNVFSVTFENISSDSTDKTQKIELVDIQKRLQFQQYENEAKGNDFKVKNEKFIVGTDNAFEFRPIVSTMFTQFDKDGNVLFVTPIPNDRTWKLDITLSEYKIDKYVPIEVVGSLKDHEYVDDFDPIRGKIDFSESAVGKTFKIHCEPEKNDSLDKPLNCDVADFEFNVKSGYNVYTADELSFIANDDPSTYLNTNAGPSYSAKKVWNKFKADRGFDNELAPKGVFLQNDIKLTKDNIPSEYFYNGTDVGPNDYLRLNHLKDENSLYRRQLEKNETFDFNGNYYKLDISDFPTTPIRLNLKPTEEHDFSHSQFIFFDGPNHDYNVDVSENPSFASISNLRTIGNSGRSADESAAGGLIMNKAKDVTFTIFNNYSVNFFISYYPEVSRAKYLVDHCVAKDSYNCFAYNWGGQDLEIRNSTLTGCGGPAIIQDHVKAQYIMENSWDRDNLTTEQLNKMHQANTRIYDSEISSEVTGEEGWFVAAKAAAFVPQIKNLNNVLTLVAEDLLQNPNIEALVKENYPEVKQLSSRTFIYKKTNPQTQESIEVMNLIGLTKNDGEHAISGHCPDIRGVISSETTSEKTQNDFKFDYFTGKPLSTAFLISLSNSKNILLELNNGACIAFNQETHEVLPISEYSTESKEIYNKLHPNKDPEKDSTPNDVLKLQMLAGFVLPTATKLCIYFNGCQIVLELKDGLLTHDIA